MNSSRFIYKLYFFLLPFGTLFNAFSEDIGIWHYFKASDIVMFVGLFSLLSKPGIRIFSKGTSKWLRLALFMIAYTTMCAFIAQLTWGDINGDSPTKVISHRVFFVGTFLCTISYNYYCFKNFISFRDLIPILKVQSVILLFVGLMQYFALSGVGIALALTEVLSRIFCIRGPEYLLAVDKGITLFGNEPSSVAILCLWIIPFIFFYAYYTRRKIYILQAFLWAFLFFNSGSSSNLISFLTMVLCLIFVILGRQIPKIMYIGAFFIGLAMAIVYAHGDLGRVEVQGERNEISYIIYGKLFDVSNNGSTAVRASTVANNIKVFEEFPFTGIGDGLQGYRFNQNAPDWVRENIYTQEMLSGEMGLIGGGGSFFAAYLSGYGLLGIIVLCMFIQAYRRDWYLMNNDFLIKNIFSVAMVIFLYSAWYTMGLSSILAFVLSLPYAANQKSSENFIAYYFGD